MGKRRDAGGERLSRGEALLTYDEDNPCPHCGRRGAERGGRVMTIGPTLDELAAAVETVRENLWRQSRWPDSVVFLQGAEARALLEYIGALERDGNGWRSVAAVRQERIVELERERG
jgi:hypothetical protein